MFLICTWANFILHFALNRSCSALIAGGRSNHGYENGSKHNEKLFNTRMEWGTRSEVVVLWRTSGWLVGHPFQPYRTPGTDQCHPWFVRLPLVHYKVQASPPLKIIWPVLLCDPKIAQIWGWANSYQRHLVKERTLWNLLRPVSKHQQFSSIDIAEENCLLVGKTTSVYRY